MERFFQFSLLLALFLVPLLPASFGLGYEQVKVVLFLILTTLAGFTWVYSNKNHNQSFNQLQKTAGVFVTILLLTSLLGSNPQNSLLGIPPYFQGWVVYAYLFLFSFLISASKINLKQIAWCLFLSSILVAAVSVQEWILLTFFHSPIPTYAGRVVSTFGQPNLYSGYILMTVPWGIYLWQISSPKIKWFILIGLLLLVTGIVVSQSRAAVAVLFLALIGWLALKVQTTFGKLTAAIGLLSVGLIVFFSAVFSLGFIWREVGEPSTNLWLAQNAPEKRVHVWRVVGDLVIKQPLTGYGLENISLAYAQYFQKFDFNSNRNPIFLGLRNLVVDRAHSYPLDLLLFSGLVGFLTWVGLLGQLIRHNRAPLLLGCLIIYLMWTIVQIQSIVHLAYFWVLVGLIGQDKT